MGPVLHGNFIRGKTHLTFSHSFNHLLFHTESDISITEEDCKMSEWSEEEWLAGSKQRWFFFFFNWHYHSENVNVKLKPEHGIHKG